MDWLSQNWFFVVLLVAFVGMHLIGHGGHGGHGEHRRRESPGRDRDDAKGDQPASRRHDHHGGD